MVDLSWGPCAPASRARGGWTDSTAPCLCKKFSHRCRKAAFVLASSVEQLQRSDLY